MTGETQKGAWQLENRSNLSDFPSSLPCGLVTDYLEPKPSSFVPQRGRELGIMRGVDWLDSRVMIEHGAPVLGSHQPKRLGMPQPMDFRAL
jgi:hypothetical protein